MSEAHTTLTISDSVRVKIFYDEYAQSPNEWDQQAQVAYCSNRYTLGSEEVSQDRLQEIGEEIAAGTLIGLPVYAYIHGGVALSTGSFSCKWDSGQSGWVYMTEEDAVKVYGKCDDIKDKALAYCEAIVEEWHHYLSGDVYGYVVEVLAEGDDENGDSGWENDDGCCGFYGSEHAEACAKEAGEAVWERVQKERAEAAAKATAEVIEKAYWESRDVCTA